MGIGSILPPSQVQNGRLKGRCSTNGQSSTRRADDLDPLSFRDLGVASNRSLLFFPRFQSPSSSTFIQTIYISFRLTISPRMSRYHALEVLMEYNMTHTMPHDVIHARTVFGAHVKEPKCEQPLQNERESVAGRCTLLSIYMSLYRMSWLMQSAMGVVRIHHTHINTPGTIDPPLYSSPINITYKKQKAKTVRRIYCMTLIVREMPVLPNPPSPRSVLVSSL